MIEEVLVNYGVAGAMLIYFIYDKTIGQKNIFKIIENNTTVMSQMCELMRGCDKRKV